jgi:serine/threonine protein kinase
MSIAPGTRFGPYEVVDLLGAGGMGEVYRARDTRLDRAVAVKVLPAAAAGDSAFRNRLHTEARAISQLSHPHICTLHDIGE